MPRYRKGRRLPWESAVTNAEGRRESRSFLAKVDAVEWEALMLRNRARERASLEPPIPQDFGVFADRWMKARKAAAQVTESTTVGEESKLLRTWKPYLRGLDLHKVTTDKLQAKLTELLAEVSPATVNRHRALLSVIFEAARAAKKVPRNPVADIPVLKESPKKQPVWTEEQIQAYLTEAYHEEFVYGALATLLVYGGPRINECLALRWSDVLWDLSAVVVQRIWEVVSGELKDRTKGQGEGGNYHVLLLPVVRRALEMWREQTKCRAEGDPIFVIDRRPIDYHHFENLHHKFVARAGLPRVTLHGLRHAFASHAQWKGLSPRDLQGLLGHASMATTERYSHRQDLRELAEKARRVGFGSADILELLRPGCGQSEGL